VALLLIRACILSAALTALLSACGTTKPVERSAAYELGFSDGCATASKEGTGVPQPPQRNEMLYASEPDYLLGWTSGHAQCRSVPTTSPLTR